MKKPQLAPKLNAQIRAEAVEWLVAFSEGEVDGSARESFSTWLRSSPEHVRAYLRISAFWQEADGIEKRRKQAMDSLVEQALMESNVVGLQIGPEAPAADSFLLRRRIKWSLAASLIVAAASVALMAWFRFNNASTYATGIGEQRKVTLLDGSTVELNARSRIRVRFNRERRLVELREGQALFRVAPQRSRPFVVASTGVSVRAVGTEFDVHQKIGGTVVTVLEGRVIVSPASLNPVPAALAAGEQVTVTAAAMVGTRRPDILAATAWTEGLLKFDAATLDEVVEEFNRHNLKPLVIADGKLKDLQISGIFPAAGSGRMVDFLKERFGIIVRETPEAIRISAR